MNKTGGTYFSPDGGKHRFERSIKTVKMNYKVDERTELGRIYIKEVLQKAFDEALEKEKNIPVVRNCSELYERGKEGIFKPVVSYKDIIGFFRGYEIRDNGDVYIKILPIIDTSLFDGNFSVSTGIIGTVDKDFFVEIFVLVGFFIAGGTDIITKDGHSIEHKIRQQELVILTGNIGCGKSSFAREEIGDLKDYIIVNDDAITTMIGGGVYTNYDKNKRSLYKSIELYCVKLGLERGYNVIVDMPNMKPESRKKFIEIGKRYSAKIVSFDWGSGNVEDLDRRKIDHRDYDKWDEAFKVKKQDYKAPSMEEGFDEIIRVETIISGENIIFRLDFEYAKNGD